MSRLHFAFIVLIRCWKRPSQSDYLKSLQPERPAQVARILTGQDTKKRVGSDLSERPAQSDYLKSLQPERPAQVARVLTGRDTKKRVGSDLLERLC
ncbi:hypothetical protein F2Q70_00020061 [Brassica cretica]|uniref:Uncharacterized protein n=1 Tax=Brassica cretica TaxID=69181 RepID=A0A8S9GWS6_BRACR|nr:hypothetical protein F2Q70_00020061 [Brassica cretica]